jgi:uncharacterized protein
MDSLWYEAIKRGHAVAIRKLFHRGAHVDARDRYGQTGLILAAHAGHRDLVAVLIEHGADLNVTAKLAIVAGHRLNSSTGSRYSCR